MLRRASPTLLAIPWLVGLAVLVGWPLMFATALVFGQPTTTGAIRYVGLDNVEAALSDPAFALSLTTSAVILAVAVPLRIGLALALALLLARDRPGAGSLRAGAFLPSVVPEPALALAWLWILNPIAGPVAGLHGLIGLGPPGYLTEPWPARMAIAVMSTFVIGEAFVIALAVRRAIPSTLFDVASVEGARTAFVLRVVTLPLMAPILALLVIRDVAMALHATFVPALMLTGGGPGEATVTYPLLVYRTAFVHGEIGVASAFAMVGLLIAAVSTGAALLLVRQVRIHLRARGLRSP